MGIGGGLPDVNGDEVSGLEALRITFPNPIALHSLWLGYIYPAGIWDNSNESVRITFDGSTAFTLTAVLGTTATITGATASVTSVEPATMGYGGVWQISFNGLGAVSTVDLAPLLQGIGSAAAGSVTCSENPTTACSDFMLVGLESVPEPATFALLGVSLIAAGAMRLRRRAKTKR